MWDWDWQCKTLWNYNKQRAPRPEQPVAILPLTNMYSEHSSSMYKKMSLDVQLKLFCHFAVFHLNYSIRAYCTSWDHPNSILCSSDLYLYVELGYWQWSNNCHWIIILWAINNVEYGNSIHIWTTGAFKGPAQNEESQSCMYSVPIKYQLRTLKIESYLGSRSTWGDRSQPTIERYHKIVVNDCRKLTSTIVPQPCLGLSASVGDNPLTWAAVPCVRWKICPPCLTGWNWTGSAWKGSWLEYISGWNWGRITT